MGNSTALVPVVVLPSPAIIPRPDTIDEMDTHLNGNFIDESMITNIPIVEHLSPKHDLNLSGTHQSILACADKLFFISYRGANTLCPRWYLVQIRLDDEEIPVLISILSFFSVSTPMTTKRRMTSHDIGLIGTR